MSTATALEGTLTQIFREVLRDGASVNDSAEVDAGSDFFELGGNSLLGARLVARVRLDLGVKVTVRDLFRARTVGALAAVIRERSGGR